MVQRAESTPLPAQAGLIGTRLCAQFGVLDPQRAFGGVAAFTRGLSVYVGH